MADRKSKSSVTRNRSEPRPLQFSNVAAWSLKDGFEQSLFANRSRRESHNESHACGVGHRRMGGSSIAVPCTGSYRHIRGRNRENASVRQRFFGTMRKLLSDRGADGPTPSKPRTSPRWEATTEDADHSSAHSRLTSSMYVTRLAGRAASPRPPARLSGSCWNLMVGKRTELTSRDAAERFRLRRSAVGEGTAIGQRT